MEQQNQQCKWNSSVPGTFGSVYLLYTGIAATVCRYADKGGRKIYKSANVFLIRQFSSKIRTMQFTMGTLTVLFTVALLVSSIALMFMDYQINMMEQANPFDILLFSPETEDRPLLEEKQKLLEDLEKLRTSMFTPFIQMETQI